MSQNHTEFLSDYIQPERELFPARVAPCLLEDCMCRKADSPEFRNLCFRWEQSARPAQIKGLARLHRQAGLYLMAKRCERPGPDVLGDLRARAVYLWLRSPQAFRTL